MSALKLTVEKTETSDQLKTETAKPAQKPAWETPTLEDVSERVMAQPYIRFT